DVSGPAFLFRHVKGHDMRVAGGLFSNPRKAEIALEVEDHQAALERFMSGLANPIDPVVVSDAPCKEIVRTGDDVDLTTLPIATYSEQDPGPFITVGVEITRDVDSGSRNAGIYRMQLYGRTEMALAASPFSDFHAMFRRAE